MKTSMLHKQRAKRGIIKNILDGASSILILSYDDDYLVPNRNGFLTDASNLSADVKKVGQDMRRAINKYHG